MNSAQFRNPDLARKLIAKVKSTAAGLGPTRIMEVCGTHTMEIGRLGLRSILPEHINVLSGPGCPVCVTPAGIIDAAINLAKSRQVTVLTFGDMIRVPGTVSSLADAKAHGALVEIVTSPLAAYEIAKVDPAHEYVFVSVGFETTIPAAARAVLLAEETACTNLTFLLSHRLVPPALDALLADPLSQLNGFILPGHVSAILGESAYYALEKHGIPSVITGFEPLDILGGVAALLDAIARKDARCINMYPRIVYPEGNPQARALIAKVFTPATSLWRGIGAIPWSGLVFNNAYSKHDAILRYNLNTTDSSMPDKCGCGAVLRGRIRPDQCSLFGTECIPDHPAGPCMVSSEGSCAAYYRFGG